MSTTKERLTDTMSDLLWERGYAATSPRDVMDRAGVGQGSLYHHFDGKHGLAVAAMSQTVQAIECVPSLLEGDGSPLERIEQYLSVSRPGVRGCPVGRMTQDPQVVEDAELSAIVAEAFSSMLDRWEHTIAHAIDAGELSQTIVASDLAKTLCAVIQGGYVLARAQSSQEPMDAAVRGAIALLEAARPNTPSSGRHAVRRDA